MRIAIVTAWYPSDKNPLYGIFIQNQAKALSAHCDVYVLLLKWSLIPYTKKRKEGDLTIIEKGDFYFPNASEQLLDFWAKRYLRFIKLQHKKYNYDLVHCHDHYGAFVGSKIKETLAVPLVCTIHNSNIMNDQLVSWKQSYLSRILGNADRVYSVGMKLKKVLEDKYNVKDVGVIPNFIDTNLFNYQPTKDDEEFKFLFVGGLETHKGVWKLIKAFHKSNIDNASLHIVGSGYLLQRIEDYIRTSDLGKRITLYGAIDNHKLPEIYNSCNVYVSVSDYETFGVTILEAMSCGLPILYTASGGPNELVSEIAGIEIGEGTIENISDGLVAIKNRYSNFDPVQIRSYVLAYYGEDNTIGVLLQEYKSLINA